MLCLDELGQLDPKEAGEAAYMLANGMGKNRCQKDGTLNKRANWRLLFNSTGEIGLAEQMRQVGRKSKAGQEVRLLDIPADAGAGLGVFENLHGFNNGSDFAQYLEQQTKNWYGAPIRAFLEQIIKTGIEEIKKRIQNLRAEFINKLEINTADGQVKRAAHRFALIAAAGELATEFGITGWGKGDACQAIKSCFDSWVSQRGGVESQEERQILGQVRQFFQENHNSRFANVDITDQPKIINSAGYFKKTLNELSFYVETEIFKQEICKGLDYRLATKICIKHGWLIKDSQGKNTCPQRLPPSNEVRRVYHFNEKVLGGEYEE